MNENGYHETNYFSCVFGNGVVRIFFFFLRRHLRHCPPLWRLTLSGVQLFIYHRKFPERRIHNSDNDYRLLEKGEQWNCKKAGHASLPLHMPKLMDHLFKCSMFLCLIIWNPDINQWWDFAKQILEWLQIDVLPTQHNVMVFWKILGYHRNMPSMAHWFEIHLKFEIFVGS